MRRIEVTKDGTGQKLWFQAREGRPASTPSVGIKDSGGTVITAAATTYVTQDPVNTTIGATAAVGVQQLTLASVTGVRMGAEYRIKNALQQTEDVIVTGIDSSGKIVYLDEPLAHAYASADTFFSCEFYRTLQTTEVDALGELFIATATYSVTGEQTDPLIVPFDVVLHPLRNRNPLTVRAIKKHWPDLTGQEWQEQAGQDYGPQREQAWDNVCEALYEVTDPDTGYRRPGMVVSAEGFLGWALAELALILQEGGVSVIRNVTPEVALERLDSKLSQRKTTALSAITWYERTEDEARDDETESRPLATHFTA